VERNQGKLDYLI